MGLVVLDLELGRDRTGALLDGVALVPPLRDSGWQVLALTEHTPPERIGATLAAGAHYTVSVATVRTQIRGILTELEVHSQLEAVALYTRHHRPEP
ncbi:hypothetical protein [Pseudonocardia parietis]|uniref:DNA-binding NarL/FixJ family response regulator n=1 Tax=Pseudonocardia parietis TaxID=570936 RepID=A0ABS4VX02_9PSEU|nr:hypothetical protein [Pseudonocardia parietis]MBP2368447.1 DNA-binding NarL/FixJ family response regulator [Pseudonocardia parietis]